MTRFVALLRAVNVGGTGLLPMADLAALCAGLGHDEVSTYIASGNLLFRSRQDEARIRRDLERALAERMGKPVEVMVRTAVEMAAVLAANPFPMADPKQVIVQFCADPVPADFIGRIKQIGANEEVRVNGREAYIRYGDGQGRSKLKLPASPAATGRNLKTVATLAELAR